MSLLLLFENPSELSLSSSSPPNQFKGFKDEKYHHYYLLILQYRI